MSLQITTVYRFLPLSSPAVARLQTAMEEFASKTALRGLCLIGPEGVNLTVSGEPSTVTEFKVELSTWLATSDLHFKDATVDRHPFQVFKVKVKEEIVTLGRPGLAPSAPVNAHLTPKQWQQALQDPETVVIDTRNDYEVDIGKFRSAIDFRMQEFREFPEAVRRAGIDKNKKILMYCTGGIRCEKAILEMREQGYGNVHQLQGGILEYLKEFPHQEFEGECFVFDYRVAVDQNLAPTNKYLLCPHCGEPGNKPIRCEKCGSEAIICSRCVGKNQNACSKNCAHHLQIGSRSTRPHTQELAKRKFRA